MKIDAKAVAGALAGLKVVKSQCAYPDAEVMGFQFRNAYGQGMDYAIKFIADALGMDAKQLCAEIGPAPKRDTFEVIFVNCEGDRVRQFVTAYTLAEARVKVVREAGETITLLED